MASGDPSSPVPPDVPSSNRGASTSFYRPAILTDLKSYNIQTLKADVTSGLVVGIVALPLSMALAIATGLPPMMGLFTAIFGGLAIALSGGSSFQVSGPTAAFIVILVPIVSQFGVNGLMVAGMMAGLILILMGAFNMGSLIKFIPYPVTTGFTAGIAVSIATTQLAGFLGLTLPARIAVDEQHTLLFNLSPEKWALIDEAHKTNFTRLEYVEKLEVLFHSLPTVNWHVVGVAAVTLGILIFWPRLVSKRLPAPLPALVIATVLALVLRDVLGWKDITLLGERYSILSTLTFSWPGQFDPRPFMTADAIANAPSTYAAPLNFSARTLQALIPAATSIAMLGAIESLLSAVVADGMTETKHDSNSELIGQGIGNIVSPLFGGFAATGAIARTATNVRNGGKTSMAAIFHALTIALIVLLAAPMAAYIPLCALSSVLLIVCWNMAEVHHFIGLLRAPRSDVLVLLTCFALTVFVDMVWAVMVGIMLASLLFMQRMSDLTQVNVVVPSDGEPFSRDIRPDEVPPGVTIYSIDGPFFFGATEKAMRELQVVNDMTQVVILRMRRVPAMDATGLYALRKVREQLSKRGVTLILSGVRTQPRSVMQRSGFADEVGPAHLCDTIDIALDQARALVKA